MQERVARTFPTDRGLRTMTGQHHGFVVQHENLVLERDEHLLVVTAGYVLINLLVDFLYSVLNPRIRIAGRAA